MSRVASNLADSERQGIFSIVRIKQMIIVSIIASSLSLINLIAYGFFSGAVLQFISMIFLALSLIFAIREKISLSISIFLYSFVFFINLVRQEDVTGLHDVVIAIYPIIVIMATLIGTLRNLIITYAIILIFIILTGHHTINNWDTIGAQKLDYSQIVTILIILIIAGIISAIFSLDFNKIVEKIKIENENLKESHRKIYQIAHYDQLTQLPNRNMASEKYQELLSDIDFDHYQLILCFIDLDNFKEINDSFSHSMGDEVLIEISKRLSHLIQSGDMISRLGGDEFLLISKRPKDFNLNYFIQDVLNKITQPYCNDGTEIGVTASLGIATVTEAGITFEEASRRADLAMYKAKQQGKNTAQYYDEALREESIRRSAIIMGLRKSVKSNLLELYFQPKVDLITNETIGAEALLRWTKENPYQSTPDEFIPLIESTDIIVEIGEWVIRQACLHCKRWHDAGFTHMHIAVNVSAMQLLRSNFSSIVESALNEATLPARYLEIELTEYLLINKTDFISKQLDTIKNMGVTIAIDDFGTGYSSLSYLTKFKVNALKLDKSFIQQISHSPKNLSIVTAIISMAKIINLSTVAEGIETTSDHMTLKKLGCQYGQGYLWSKPIPSDIFLSNLCARQ